MEEGREWEGRVEGREEEGVRDATSGLKILTESFLCSECRKCLAVGGMPQLCPPPPL